MLEPYEIGDFALNFFEDNKIPADYTIDKLNQCKVNFKYKGVEEWVRLSGLETENCVKRTLRALLISADFKKR